MYPLLSQTETT